MIKGQGSGFPVLGEGGKQSFKTVVGQGAKERAQWVRAFAAFAKDPCTLPSTRMAAQKGL